MIGLTDENVLANTIQSIKDLLYGGLTQRNMKSIRTYFVVNAMDSLDSNYPMYVPFSIPADTVKVVSVYVNFTLLPFRAYSKSAASAQQMTTSAGGGTTVTSSAGGGQTTSAGGGTTITSTSGGATTTSSGGATKVTSAAGGGQTTSSGGGATTSSGGATTTTSTPNTGHFHQVPVSHSSSTSHPIVRIDMANWRFCANTGGSLTKALTHVSGEHTHSVSISSHTHTVYAHTHTVSSHTHSVTLDNHTHTIGSHSHNVTLGNHDHTVSNHSHNVTIADHVHTVDSHSHNINFGIYEIDTHPDVTLYVSRDGGATYPYRIGTYSNNQELIEITQYVDSPGGKMLKFEATDLGRLSAQIEIKVDISK